MTEPGWIEIHHGRSERSPRVCANLLQGLRPGDDAFSPATDGPPRKPMAHPFFGVSSGLEHFVQELMNEAVKSVCLDGASLYRVRKIAPLTAELVGACRYIEQTLAPLFMRLRAAEDVDRVDWCRCCLGELGRHGEITRPASDDALGVAIRTAHRQEKIHWKHCVEYGEPTGLLSTAV